MRVYSSSLCFAGGISACSTKTSRPQIQVRCGRNGSDMSASKQTFHALRRWRAPVPVLLLAKGYGRVLVLEMQKISTWTGSHWKTCKFFNCPWFSWRHCQHLEVNPTKLRKFAWYTYCTNRCVSVKQMQTNPRYLMAAVLFVLLVATLLFGRRTHISDQSVYLFKDFKVLYSSCHSMSSINLKSLSVWPALKHSWPI